ncbi:MAG: hypothetical protein FJ224_05790 [Lentisphaerae bacterium]|nr:hypothetical protein [Lentisphaerota bacterium]
MLAARILRAIPYAATAIYLAGVALTMSRHEMWRDEIQAWLLARDSATPWALLHNMRYEGHPGLWHLLLWLPAHLTANPVAMQVVHAAIAAAAMFVLLRFAPFHLVSRLLLCGGYFFAYEWAVISRNYAISVLLLFLVATVHGRRWGWFLLQAVLLFALCHTNVHSILLVLILAPMLAIEYAVDHAGDTRGARAALGRVVVGFAIVAIGLFSGIRQVTPPDGSGFAEKWKWDWQTAHVRSTANRVTNAYLPWPTDELQFWNRNRITEKLPPERHVRVALVILGVGCLLFITQPWPIVPYLAGSLALLTFFHVKYPGSFRHHGFLFLWFVTLLWMTWDYRRWRLPWRRADLPVGVWHRCRDILLWPLLLVHIAGTCVAVKHDWRSPFSAASAAAAWLRGTYGDGRGHVFVADSAPKASAVVGYMPLDRIHYARRGEFGSYVIWDKQWQSRKTIRHAVTELLGQGTNDLVLVLSDVLPHMPRHVSITPVAEFTTPSISGEAYTIYHVSNLTARAAAR